METFALERQLAEEVFHVQQSEQLQIKSPIDIEPFNQRLPGVLSRKRPDSRVNQIRTEEDIVILRSSAVRIEHFLYAGHVLRTEG